MSSATWNTIILTLAGTVTIGLLVQALRNEWKKRKD